MGPLGSVHHGTIFYDGDCRFCAAGARRLGGALRRRGFALTPLQSPQAAQKLGIVPERLLDEVKLLKPDGVVLGGIDAVLCVARFVPWGIPLWLVSFVPGARPLLRWGYRRFAAARYCMFGRCGMPRAGLVERSIAWLPLMILGASAVTFGRRLEPWMLMWCVAGALFFGCKWLTWRHAPRRLRASRLRSILYLFAWCGMDAERFLDRSRRPARAKTLELVRASCFIGAGVLLIWVAPLWLGPLARGYAGLLALALLLHFGLFDLLSVAYRCVGIDASPIMDRPSASGSLAELWSRRWNRAFYDLCRTYVFHPARRFGGPAAAVMLTFAVSGLIHELAITLPAGAGWGGPTLYFLIQGAGMLLERRFVPVKLRRATAVILAIAPLPLLFPMPFIERVIMPFMDAIGSPSARFTVQPVHFIRAAGILHFGILLAGALLPFVLDWRSELMRVSAMTRHIIWTHGSFIVMVIVGFGATSLLLADELAGGSVLGRAICAFVAAFWATRLVLQFILFDARPYLTNWFLRLGYHGLTIVFAYFALTYGWAATLPGA
jgi:alginate O-acetyltransferase complex protein AlgI